MQIDIVVDNSRGDAGKGKITHSLLKSFDYDMVVKTSGSSNAGHTIYHEEHKFITHLIPAGVFHGVISIIGKNCLLHPATFLQEIKDLQAQFDQVDSLKSYDLSDLVRIDQDTFIITDEHVKEDAQDTVIGTTKKGTGPAARDKYARTGKQAKDIPEFQNYMCDLYEMTSKKDCKILCEGAQGFYLDVHFGQYPYVTSSHCTTAAAMLCGLPFSAIDKVFGIIKAYETYVGAMKFEGEDPIFSQMREIGREFGSTTGRARQCNYLHIDELRKAIHINGCTHLIVNKMDVLKKLNCWKIRDNNSIIDLKTEDDFKKYLNNLTFEFPRLSEVMFSYSPDQI